MQDSNKYLADISSHRLVVRWSSGKKTFPVAVVPGSNPAVQITCFPFISSILKCPGKQCSEFTIIVNSEQFDN